MSSERCPLCGSSPSVPTGGFVVCCLPAHALRSAEVAEADEGRPVVRDQRAMAIADECPLRKAVKLKVDDERHGIAAVGVRGGADGGDRTTEPELEGNVSNGVHEHILPLALNALDWYLGKLPGFHAEVLGRAMRHADEWGVTPAYPAAAGLSTPPGATS